MVDQHRVMRKFWTLEAFTELPRCASSFIFCTFFSFLTEGKFDWTCLHFALFSPFHFSFHWTSSLCIQPRIKRSVCKPWIWLREKLVGHVYILHFFERKVDWTCILHFFNVDWTCLHFALFQCWLDMFTFCIFLREKVDGTILHFERKVNWTNLNFALCLGEKLMGNVYILREKMIGHVYILQLFSPFNFSFHWTQYLFIQVLIKCT